METWIIWAIVWAITSWLYNFGFKVITKRKYSTYYASLWSYSIASIICFFFIIADGFKGFSDVNVLLMIFLAFWNILFFYVSVITRVKSMKNIDNVIFYPLYKTFWPILVTLISLFYFKESLSITESIGIMLGICIPLMLISKAESKRQKNLTVGLLFMFFTAIASAISPIFVKLWSNSWFDTMAYVFLVFFMWLLFSLTWYIYERKKSKKSNQEWMMKFWLIIWLFHFLSFYAFTKSFEWNLAIAFTINSFAILIPIILSIIFYGEHFNLKKGVVIVLSIVSILLFI